MSPSPQDERRVLTLLASDPLGLCREFASAATRCGFAVRVLGRRPETQAPPSDARLVLVCSNAADAKAFQEWMGGLAGARPCLGVVGLDAAPSATALTRACSDVLYWPATVEEVGLRLERFSREPVPEAPVDLAAEFATLNMVGRSEVFQGVIRRIKRIALTEATVLIEGPTGTGKELVARAIHYMGPRRGKAFAPVNCGALPDTLIENELFGHEPGAFTDARRMRTGVIEQAGGGTLLLDEVEALPPKGQVILLRFLENQEYRPLGARAMKRADVRVIAASNRPLREMAEAGEFRADLLYRLNVLNVELPPLSERREDVAPLCRRILAKLRSRYGGPEKRLTAATLSWLEARPWPGNVRELENVLHRAYVMSDSEHIVIEEEPAASPPAAGSFQEAKRQVIERFERQYLEEVMAEANGNVTLAAKIAGKERRALGRLLKKHGLGPSR